MVAVAQLVESRIVIPVVVGSSPISHPNKINTFGISSISQAFSHIKRFLFHVYKALKRAGIEDFRWHDYYDTGDIVPGSGGCIKVRWSRKGTGKSGGLRAIYYNMLEDGTIWLLLIYAKNEHENIGYVEINY